MKRLLIGFAGWFLFFSATVFAQAKPSWQLEWEKTVDGAKKEGKLSLYLYQGDGELAAVADAFHKKYPEIAVTTVTGRGNQLGPRIMAERRAEKYLTDVYISGPTTPYTVFYRAKVLEPIRPQMILPEVSDESKWWQGKHHYIDPDGKYIFVFVGNASGGYVAYNSKLVDAAKFSSYWEFLDPRWKGKILSMDPSEPAAKGSESAFFTTLPSWGRSTYGACMARWR